MTYDTRKMTTYQRILQPNLRNVRMYYVTWPNRLGESNEDFLGIDMGTLSWNFQSTTKVIKRILNGYRQRGTLQQRSPQNSE